MRGIITLLLFGSLETSYPVEASFLAWRYHYQVMIWHLSLRDSSVWVQHIIFLSEILCSLLELIPPNPYIHCSAGMVLYKVCFGISVYAMFHASGRCSLAKTVRSLTSAFETFFSDIFESFDEGC